MISKIDRKEQRVRRHARVRTKISGTAERPTLFLVSFFTAGFNSPNSIYVRTSYLSFEIL